MASTWHTTHACYLRVRVLGQYLERRVARLAIGVAEERLVRVRVGVGVGVRVRVRVSGER